MQKGVQKTEEMLVKVKDKYYWLLFKENFWQGSTITGIGEVVSGPMGVR